jgi:hypothetical protein
MARAAGTYMYSQGCIVQSSSLQNLLGTAVHWAGNLQQIKRTRSAESALWRQVSGGATYSTHTNLRTIVVSQPCPPSRLLD